jgi:hypothetical protein
MAQHPNVARAGRMRSLCQGRPAVLTVDADGKITNLWDLPVDAEVHDRFLDGR